MASLEREGSGAGVTQPRWLGQPDRVSRALRAGQVEFGQAQRPVGAIASEGSMRIGMGEILVIAVILAVIVVLVRRRI